MFWKNNKQKEKSLSEILEEIEAIKNNIENLSRQFDIVLVKKNSWRLRSDVRQQLKNLEVVYEDIPVLKQKIENLKEDIRRIPEDINIDWSQILIPLAVVGVVLLGGGSNSKTYVDPYTRSNGTRVKGHWRKKSGSSLVISEGARRSSSKSHNDFEANRKKESKDLSPKEQALIKCDDLFDSVRQLEFKYKYNVNEALKYMKDPVGYQKKYNQATMVKSIFIACGLIFLLFILIALISS